MAQLIQPVRTLTSEATACASERERPLRHRRMIIARMSGYRAVDQEIVIRNVSRRGLGAATQGVVQARGERVLVRLNDGLEITGVVRWRDGPCFGLALDCEIEPAMLADVERTVRAAIDPVWEVNRIHRIRSPRVEASKLRRL